MNPILLVAGTRPEGIKIAPVYFALKELNLPVLLCATFQHTNLLSSVFDLFKITPDFSLNIMRENQDLFHITNSVLIQLKEVYEKISPKLIVVQGDTTTVMAACLAAYYKKIPVAHVEAGIRTNDIYSPFPEELNRKFVSLIAKYNFVPTNKSAENLTHEGIKKETIFLTGNTVTDSLRIIKEKIDSNEILITDELKEKIKNIKKQNKKIILLTTHRRESFNGGTLSILSTIKNFALKNNNVFFFYPYHPNPKVLEAIESSGIKNIDNIYLREPLSYQDLVYLLLNSDIVATDSGGLQEEAASLGKPSIILREKTDRPESVEIGLSKLVGTNPEKIILALNEFLESKITFNTTNIFGDGFAAKKIAEIIKMHEYDMNLKAESNILRINT